MLEKYNNKSTKSVVLRTMTLAAFVPLVLNSQAQAITYDIYSPSLGSNSIYTLVETPEESNTGAFFTLPDGTKKYIDIKKTTYTLTDGSSGNLGYSWNNSTRRFTITSEHNSTQRYGMTILDGDYVRSNGGTGGAVYSISNNYDTVNVNVLGTTADYGSIHISGGNLNTFNANFIGNRVSYSGAGFYLKGNGTVGSINGDFIGNCAGSGSTNYGGGIFNMLGTISDIKGDFILNSAGKGGAIHNSKQIGNITGNFFGNKAVYQGGAISNDGTISGVIKGNFIGNYAYRPSGTAYGGAIYSNKDITVVSDNGFTSRFEGNYVEDRNGKRSESIYMANADSTLNFVQSSGGNFVLGDAINGADGYKVNITGDNTGTVYLADSIKNAEVNINGVDMNTANGKTFSYDFKTLNFDPETKWTTEIDLANQSADKFTIQNTTTDTMYIDELNILNPQDNLDKEFIVQILDVPEDTMQLELSDNLKNELDNKEYLLSSVTNNTQDEVTQHTNWKDEFHTYSQTTDTYGKLNLATTQTTNDSLGIYVSTVDEQPVIDNGKFDDTLAMVNQAELSNRDFNFDSSEDEYVVSSNLGQTASGILTVNGKTDIIPSAQQGNSERKSTIDFANNNGFEINNENTTVNLNDVKIENAGFIARATKEDSVINLNNVNFDGSNNEGIQSAGTVNISGTSYLKDPITLTSVNAKLNLNRANNITLDNEISGIGLFSVNKSNVKMGKDAKIAGVDTIINRSTIKLDNEDTFMGVNTKFNGNNTFDIANNEVKNINFGKLELTGRLKLKVDADLANKSMDTISASSVKLAPVGKIDVEKINLISPTTKKELQILFTDNEALAKRVKYTGNGTIAYSPVYKYDTSYNMNGGKGYFTFSVPESPEVNSFNPAVLASPVATQVGANAAMNEALRFAFEHGDTFMNFSSMDRFAKANDNVYALSTDYNDNAGYVDFSHENKSVWVKPYSVFESINLKNGPKVDTISYGSLIGFDSNIHRLKKGWYNVGTGYIGYNGAQIDYKGVDAFMNGGLLGLTETFYKGNFWTALTATVGAAGVEAHTMYGKDDMAMLMTGIGSKTGYNFEFADGKFIIQPRIFVAYSMVNTFDYTNAAGVKIDSDPMHTIQLNPAIKFIGNTKNGWQPYASVGMTWNLLNETDTMANGVRLPEMHTKPYVEYGVGVQKLWNDKYSAYGQAMVRNGGRTSVALTLGFRSALGEDGKPIEKTQAKPNESTRTSMMGFVR